MSEVPTRLLSQLAHLCLRLVSVVPVAALLASAWALYLGPNTQVGFSSRARAMTGDEPEMAILGWHVIGWSVFATACALVVIMVLLPLARRDVERREYRRMLSSGATEEHARLIARDIANDFGR